MKQSTKLLSLVLAIIMAFSCMTVIGNAAGTITTAEAMTYDSIDDAVLTPEQVADIALDLVDGLLADMDFHENIVDLGFLGKIDLDLRSINLAFSSLWETSSGGLFQLAQGAAGDVANLEFGALNSGNGAHQRKAGNNLVMVYQLLQFLADNASTVVKALKGIGTSGGLSLGLIGNFIGDSLDDINDILVNLDSFVAEMIYDELLHGSKRHPLNAEELKAAGQGLPYGGSLDSMLNNAILNLVVDPQEYEYDEETDEKIWDENSVLIPSLKAELGENEKNRATVLSNINIDNKSVFDILDYVAQFAIDDLGVNALNHNLKKGLMEAVEVEFVEIEKDDVPGDTENDIPDEVADIFANEAAYTTFIGYDCMAKDEETGDWYYTTMKTVDVINPATGKPLTDENGVVTERKRLYYKANTALANEFYDLINWDYEILKSTDAEANSDANAGLINCIDYDYFVTGTEGYGSIVESLNHIIYIVYENALTDDIKADFESITGAGWIDGATSATLEDSEEKIINYNINRLVKYLLVKFPGMIFGKDSAYALEKAAYEGDDADYYAEKYADMSIIDMVALIGPGFFEDVMPQLVMPVDENGAYAFAKTENGQSVALLQFGALVLREFMTEIAPNVNYDAYIFAEGTLTSAEGRQFAVYDDPEAWFNIILNMGVDIGYTYLGNITNFGDKFTFTADGTAIESKSWRNTTLPEAPKDVNDATSASRWMGKLDKAIEWAVGYVGQGSNGVITGINPTEVAKIEGPFNKLSYVLNTILPLGFVNGCNTYVKNADGTETGYDLDVAVVFEKLKSLLTTFDLTQLASLFGRNGDDGSVLKKDNILTKPVVPMALDLVNDILYLVFGAKIFPATDTLDNVLVVGNLQTVVTTLLTRLNAVKKTLLLSALPVVGKLIKGWGTEQNFSSPDLDMDSVVDLENGSGSIDVKFSNTADGIWRSWMEGTTRKYDQQYSVKITKVEAKGFDGKSNVSGVTIGEYSTAAIAYGGNTTFNISFSGTANQFVRVDVYYQVYEGNDLFGTTYVESGYVYVVGKETDVGQQKNAITTGLKMGVYSPVYIDLTGDVWQQIQDASIVFVKREDNDGDQQFMTAVKPNNAGVDGITPGSAQFGTPTEKDGDYMGTGSKRYWDPLKIFVNHSQNPTGDKSDPALVITGAGFDASKFSKTSGQRTDLSFYFTSTSGSNKCADTSRKVEGNETATLVYYDLTKQPDLIRDTEDEIAMSRVVDDYKTEGFSYADRVLATETVKDEETGEITYKETNSTLTAWVDEKGVEIDTTVTPVTPEKDNEEIGTYYVDGVKQSAKLVTKINNSNAKDGKNVWQTYVDALNRAADGAWSPFTINGVFDYEDTRIALNAAATDLSYCVADTKADTSVDDAIDTENSEEDLKGLLNSVEEAYTDDYDYTDYMMWRLNRLNDARDDAAYYINLKKDADRVYDQVNQKFPYTSIEEDDLRALVALADNNEEIKNKGYDTLILALLEDLTKEEAAAKRDWLADRDKEYAGVTAFDIALAKSMLEKTSTRLRDRDYKVNGKADTTHLATEIASAKAMFTDSSLYTEKSWNRYAAALAKAEAVVNGDSQKVAFDAKWELLCCRNELVLVEEAADYSELETLINQAKFALSNQDKYDNTKKELGQVLAELGIEGEVVTADGDGINLFPGSALYTFAEPYTKEDQDIIDDAADQLKEALARLKFYDVGITAVEGQGDVVYDDDATIVFDDLLTKDVDETVKVKLATIGAGLSEEAVKGLFNVTATGATVGSDNITVSNDRHYALEKFEEDEEGNLVSAFKGFAGTNSVVTFYTVQGGIKIPVATIKLVVNGDINGDGTVDVIDAAQLHLATKDVQFATLEGCYFVAGNLAGATDDTRVIDGDDYTQIINAVVA